ncbi:MAG TPA: MFS transporter [Vicinamibacteria bacterium]|nr:MFS transporter [Vicinamibacteria bacterium]
MAEAAPRPPARPSIAARLGLDRPELRAWGMYDWANSAFMTTVLQVFPIYFVSVAAKDLPAAVANARFAWATAVAMILIAVVSPVLGAIADYAGAKKRMLAVSVTFGVAATAALSLVGPGEWRLGAALYILANIGANASLVFYEALLPHIAREDEIDRVSTAAYALGYLGGGLLLLVNALWIAKPELFGLDDSSAGVRLSFLSAAVWWAVFSGPVFRWVPEPPRIPPPPGARHPVAAAVFGLRETLRDLRTYKHACLLLLAFLLYNDGIQTVIRMGTAYGTELGIAPGSLIAAVVMIQFVGVPFAFLFGALAGRLGVKRTLFIPVVVYVLVVLWGYWMKTATDFFVLAFMVATVLGGSQALSRSLFATLIPRQRSGEFFGFWSVFEKLGGVLGPLVFAATISATGSGRPALLSLIVFFVLGGFLLIFVDVEEGRRRAREAEAALEAR